MHAFGQVGNITGDFFRAQFGVARHHIKLFDVDGGVAVGASHFLGNQNRVFVVVAVPRHKGDGHVLTKREFAQVSRSAVGNQITTLQHVTSFHGRALVDVGRLVGTGEFHQVVDVHTHFAGCGFFVVHAHHDTVGIHILHHAAATSHDSSGRVNSHGALDAGTDQRFFGTQAGHGLTLHVGTHQGTVGVIVLQERNQRGCHRHYLAGGHVHILHAVGAGHDGFAFFAAGNQIAFQVAFLIHFGVGLRNHITAFFNGRQIVDFIGNLAVYHAAVRSFQEAVIVGAGINR